MTNRLFKNIINLDLAERIEPKPHDFIFDGFVAGTVGAMIGQSGAGKSFLAIQMAMEIAIKQKVVYLSGEDPESELERRIYYVFQYFNKTERAEIKKNMVMVSINGLMANIVDKNDRQEIIENCKGSRLIIFDTLSRIHTLDENSNGEMARLISILENIARETGAGIMYIHHINKQSLNNNGTGLQTAARGASSLIDNVRYCASISKMTEEEGIKYGIADNKKDFYLKYSVVKQNYGLPEQAKWFERKQGGVLVPVNLTKGGEDEEEIGDF